VLGVVAGLMFNAAATYTHDFYVNVMKKGQVDPGSEVRMAKWAVVWLAIAGVAVTVALMRQNVEFLLSFEVNLAASTVLPVVVYSLFWKRFNTSGMLWTIYGGGALAAMLEFFGPEISGGPTVFFTSAIFDLFPCGDVGLVSVPVAFLLGYLGSRFGKAEDRTAYAELEVRVLTGVGAEQPSLTGAGVLAASDGLREAAAGRPSRAPRELSRPHLDPGGQARCLARPKSGGAGPSELEKAQPG
jgi:cation/acetate symporter